MCLAVPGKIIELNGEKAVIDFDGIRRSAVVSLLQDPRVGEYVIVHAGFAIQRWSEKDVAEYREIMREITDLDKNEG
jgi:hydrogenase expression/formation protein HypC